MRAEIIKLRQFLNSTFLYVTQDQTEAKTLGDRIVIMKDGILIVNTLDLGGRQFTLGEEIEFIFLGSVANIFDRDSVNLVFGPYKTEEAEAL